LVRFINKKPFLCFMGFVDDVIKELKSRKRISKKDVEKIKKRVGKKYGLKEIPKDVELLLKLKDEKLKRILLRKPFRTASGVAVVAVMTMPKRCPHGKCLMCPGGPGSFFGDVPQSYTGKEPATRRAIRNDYDAYLQVMNRLEHYAVQGHNVGKVELIIMGGTFPSYSARYQKEFVKFCFKAMNDFSKMFFYKGKFDMVLFKNFFELPSKLSEDRTKKIKEKLLVFKNLRTEEISRSFLRHYKDIRDYNDMKDYDKSLKKKFSLEEVQKRNETSLVKCVGLTIETRPDYAKLRHANLMLELGCTRVELGVQSVYDDVLKAIQRGHSVKDSVIATRILKDLGFKINYHMMLGLPKSNEKRDINMLKELFLNEDFRPDMLKIYPTMVLKGTKLYELWKKGEYRAIATKNAARIIVEFKKFVPEYVRIMRVQRDIPTFMTEAGVDKTNLRQYISEILKKNGIKCNCIRCREIGLRKPKKYRIKVLEYSASKGKEFFIQAVDNENRIYGFLRLRFPSQVLRKEITEKSALVRELHVYGPLTSFYEKGNVQHKGLGKKLLKRGEELAKKHDKNKMVVISGIGARDYYRKLGYKKEGVYMVKKI